MIMFPQLLPLLTVLSIFFEGNTQDYDIGLDSSVVIAGVFAVVKENIIPIMTLMGVMLGYYLVMRAYKASRKGRIA